jgi:hypothetical protein
MKPACIMLNPQAPSFTPSHTDKNQSQSTSHEKAKSNKQLAESAEPTEDDKTEELKPNFKAASPQETHNKNVVLPIPEAALIGHDHGTPAVDPLVDASIASDEASVGSTGFSDKKQRDLHAYGEESPSASNKNNEIARQYLLNQTSLHTRPFAHRFHLDLQGLHREPSATGGHGSEPTADERIGCSSNRMTATNEQSVVDNEVKKPDLRVTMHHPRPVLNLQNQSKNLEETKQRDIIDQLGSPRGSCTSEQTIHQRSASHTSTPSIKKEGGIEDPVKTLFDLLVPTLAIATAFPGVMNLEFQFGLNPIINMENPSQNHEYNHEELRRLFSPNENGVYRPPTTFFNRLTTSPADIDHIISLQVEGRRIFDDQVNNWGIKYDFHCYVDTDRAIIISVGSRQNFMIHYPEVTLGSVHLNFPGQIWDASATLLGFIGCPVGTDMDLDRIALKMVKSMSIEPNSGSLRFLFRPPKTRITVGKITMERCTRHKYECDNISGIYLQIKETQELYTTVSILDPRIMVAQTGSREDMLRDGTQWWQASVISTSVERILATNKFTMPGAANGGWTPEDVLDDVGGTAGLRAMFDVSKMVVEGIDAVGFWNKGPTSLLVKTGTLDELIASSEGDEEAHSLSSLGSDCLDAFDM